MPENPLRIIIDTNLWISFLISGNARLDELLFSGKVILIFSEELLREFTSVANRPKFKRFFDLKDVEALLLTIGTHAEFITVKTQVKLCRDPKDDFLLALALDSNADVLLSGDSDLLEIGEIGQTSIMTMTRFLEMI
jgi:uncharacterized protein